MPAALRRAAPSGSALYKKYVFAKRTQLKNAYSSYYEFVR
jgi:hypothetical protein